MSKPRYQAYGPNVREPANEYALVVGCESGRQADDLCVLLNTYEENQQRLVAAARMAVEELYFGGDWEAARRQLIAAIEFATNPQNRSNEEPTND